MVSTQTFTFKFNVEFIPVRASTQNELCVPNGPVVDCAAMSRLRHLLNDGIYRTLDIKKDDANQAEVLKEFQKLQAKAKQWMKEYKAIGKD
ncbi:MAG: hypothetical protein LQ350_005639 [Teloschistes chrysophthalmus]|nr:MAG: hypothetical protein LQ350_005639 [Niorma chrysophthalma]